MNKKFSTLVTALLLSGALGTVNAKTVTVTSQKELKKYIENGVLTGLEGGDELVIKALANGKSYTIPFYNQKNGGSGEYVIVTTPNITIKGDGNPEIVGRLVLKADNITNHRYYDIGSVLQPGIWVMAGAKVKMAL